MGIRGREPELGIHDPRHGRLLYRSLAQSHHPGLDPDLDPYQFRFLRLMPLCEVLGEHR